MDKEILISSLIERGWFTTDSFLDLATSEALVTELLAAPLRPAKIGRAGLEAANTSVRNDSIYWINQDAGPAQKIYLEKINEIMSLLNRELYLGLKQFEGHFARYDQAGFYKKHIDQFADNLDRKVTVVTYLNTPKSGGEIRIYKRDNPEEIEIDLAPIAGRLVCFLSNQIYHEVLPTNTERLSIAGWLRTNIC